MPHTANTYRRLERIVKGFANHRRIQMMGLLRQSPELSVEEIAHRLRINMKTASEHLRRLAIAGLILKRNEGRQVRHALSDRGIDIHNFVKTLE
jgi:DNA-binding transcriptional ArsR family regulator